MPETAPVVKVDRITWNKVELYVTEQILYRLADMIDGLTAAGPIPMQIGLPPAQAERKRALMEGQHGSLR